MAKRRRARKRAIKRSSFLLWACALLCIAILINFAIQVYRKPSEIVGVFEGSFHKTPQETWAAYGNIFEEKATTVLTPDLLAALAQLESNGNPIVRTYWKWRWTTDWGHLFAPASSAVGMFQITDGTFEEARRFCVRQGEVFQGGENCEGSSLYSRLVPAHAIEMTSARLHHHAEKIVDGRKRVGLRERQALATIIHLCGVGKGERFARARFDARRIGRCGDHDPSAYLSRVRRFQAYFKKLSHERQQQNQNQIQSENQNQTQSLTGI